MPSRPVPVVLLVAALLLALALAGPPAWSPVVLRPAAAAAQSAGDDQYADPFAPGDSSSGHSSAPPKAAPTSTPAPAAVAGTATSAPTAAAAQQNDQLPRTGGEPLLIGLAGVGLVIAGVLLRLRLHGD